MHATVRIVILFPEEAEIYHDRTFLGAGLHWWHGLPSSVHLAGVAPVGAGFMIGNVDRRRFSLELATQVEGLPLGSLVFCPGSWALAPSHAEVMVVVIAEC